MIKEIEVSGRPLVWRGEESAQGQMRGQIGEEPQRAHPICGETFPSPKYRMRPVGPERFCRPQWALSGKTHFREALRAAWGEHPISIMSKMYHHRFLTQKKGLICYEL